MRSVPTLRTLAGGASLGLGKPPEGAIPTELEAQRVWRSPIDRTVLVLNESGQFEAMFRLSERHPASLECV